MEERDHLSKKKKMEERGPKNVDLPPEIIHEIVSRLPAKALYRFKLVSKQWLSLITDPYFMANYNKAAIENKDVFISRRRLVFTIRFRQSPNRLYSLDLDQILYNVSRHNLVATPTELDFISGNADLHSSCNGLFLSKVCSNKAIYSNNYSYSLNNPVTKESKKLPKPPNRRLQIVPLHRDLYGLGFDHSIDEYKVVNGKFYKDDGLVFSVYTLQTDSWRHINYLNPHLYPCLRAYEEGILVNGALHWLARKLHDESPVIISFLLAKEEVREIALPTSTNVPSVWARLGAFRNSLCITKHNDSTDELWVMKDYGVSDSWTIMQISLPWHRLQHSGFWTESHDLMLINNRSLVMYNFNDDTFWNLSIDSVEHDWFGNVGIYLESLLPSSLIDARP